MTSLQELSEEVKGREVQGRRRRRHARCNERKVKRQHGKAPPQPSRGEADVRVWGWARVSARVRVRVSGFGLRVLSAVLPPCPSPSSLFCVVAAIPYHTLRVKCHRSAVLAQVAQVYGWQLSLRRASPAHTPRALRTTQPAVLPHIRRQLGITARRQTPRNRWHVRPHTADR